MSSSKIILTATLAAVGLFATTGLTPAQAAGWSCSAPGLVEGSYSGGSTAYIHLSGFSTGGRYRVTKKGNTATGVTQNGTRFTCRKS